MKLVGRLTLYCETNAAVPDLMEAVAVLSEFLRCWSEIFDLILHFLYFNLENSCSQVPKSMNKAWLQNKGYFGLKNLVKRHGQMVFWVEYLIATQCIPFENSHVMYLCRLKMESQIYQKIHHVFVVLKLILKFFYLNGKHGCIFFAVHMTVFSQCITIHTIICHNWVGTAQHCPHPGFSPGCADCTLLCGCCEWRVCSRGWAGALSGAEPSPWWHGASRVNWAGLIAAYRLWIGHVWLSG